MSIVLTTDEESTDSTADLLDRGKEMSERFLHYVAFYFVEIFPRIEKIAQNPKSIATASERLQAFIVFMRGGIDLARILTSLYFTIPGLSFLSGYYKEWFDYLVLYKERIQYLYGFFRVDNVHSI